MSALPAMGKKQISMYLPCIAPKADGTRCGVLIRKDNTKVMPFCGKIIARPCCSDACFENVRKCQPFSKSPESFDERIAGIGKAFKCLIDGTVDATMHGDLLKVAEEFSTGCIEKYLFFLDKSRRELFTIPNSLDIDTPFMAPIQAPTMPAIQTPTVPVPAPAATPTMPAFEPPAADPTPTPTQAASNKVFTPEQILALLGAGITTDQLKVIMETASKGEGAATTSTSTDEAADGNNNKKRKLGDMFSNFLGGN